MNIFMLMVLVIMSNMLYACESSKITLIYNLGDHEIRSEVDYQDLADYNVLLPSKEGASFGGWYTDELFENKFNKDSVEDGATINLYAKWLSQDTYTVKIVPNKVGAFTFIGKQEQIISKDNPCFESVKVNENLGYKFKYYEIDGVKFASDTIAIDSVTKDMEIRVVADYATYELPIVNIDTGNVAINSREQYTDMVFSIENCDKELNDITGGIRLRGNSTSSFIKKPYRIKFDKKQELFGLDKAKSWVLLADYIDPSALHNYAAFTLGNSFDNLSFTPTPNKVNVYLNGEFVGLYTLCEQVQENEGRMNIELDEITEEMTDLKDFNFFVSMDESVAADPTAILNETYFYIEEYNKYIELKYPEKDQFVSEEQFENFFSQLKVYMKNIFDIFQNQDTDKIEEETNISSLVDYLIIDQIMGEQDHISKSFNMYYTHTSENEKENNKLNFGPIWDYDWALYKPWTGLPNEYYEISNDIIYTNIFFQAIMGISDFSDLVKERYRTTGAGVLTNLLSDLYIVEASMYESLQLNHAKWYYNLDKNITFKNIEFLNKYLINRKHLLDTAWAS